MNSIESNDHAVLNGITIDSRIATKIRLELGFPLCRASQIRRAPGSGLRQ
ncbi:MAG: hypothetical protein WDM91_22270 [Rhizomicrobium sp.]